MFLPGKRKGASLLIRVVIMAVVMSVFAISVSQLSRSRSSTLISDATEKQVLYLAEDAVSQMIYNLSSGGPKPIGLTAAPDVGPNHAYEAFYASSTKLFGQACLDRSGLLGLCHRDDGRSGIPARSQGSNLQPGSQRDMGAVSRVRGRHRALSGSRLAWRAT